MEEKILQAVVELSKEVEEIKELLNIRFDEFAEQLNVISERVNTTDEKSHLLEVNLDRLVDQFSRMVKTTERLLNRVEKFESSQGSLSSQRNNMLH